MQEAKNSPPLFNGREPQIHENKKPKFIQVTWLKLLDAIINTMQTTRMMVATSFSFDSKRAPGEKPVP